MRKAKVGIIVILLLLVGFVFGYNFKSLLKASADDEFAVWNVWKGDKLPLEQQLVLDLSIAMRDSDSKKIQELLSKDGEFQVSAGIIENRLSGLVIDSVEFLYSRESSTGMYRDYDREVVYLLEALSNRGRIPILVFLLKSNSGAAIAEVPFFNL